MAKLLLVRHGRTRLHQADRFWGSTDIPLGDEGIHQAELLRDRLAGEKIDVVYSSDLGRTRQTAEIVAAPREIPIQIEPAINECNFGFMEGLTYSEIIKQNPDLNDVLMGNNVDKKFPGGESLSEFDTRVKRFIPRLNDHKQKETILVVAHGGSIPLLLCHLIGIPVRHWRQLRISQASLSIVDTYPEISILSLLNDTSHLQHKGE